MLAVRPWMGPLLAASLTLAAGGGTAAIADRIAVGGRIASLETASHSADERLVRIENKLDRLLERKP